MNSIRFKLISGFIIFTFLLEGILFFSNQYAINVVQKQVVESYGKTVELYIDQIDSELANVDKYINIIAEYDRNLAYMRESKSDKEYNVAKINFYNQNINTISIYNNVNLFFVYSKERKDFLELYNTNIAYEEKENIRNYLSNLTAEESKLYGYNSSIWEVHQVKDQYYLLHIFITGDLSFGACVKMNDLINSIKTVDIGEKGYAFFAEDDRQIISDIIGINEDTEQVTNQVIDLTNISEQKKFQSIMKKSNKGNFQFEIIIPNIRILEKLPDLQRVIILLLFISIFVILAGLYLIRKTILMPLKMLVYTMKKTKNGNLEARIIPYKTSDEFMIVNQTFNTMVSEIQTLKIEIYEEQIKRQKEELHRLQLQLNPHFYLNSLNIIYNISKMGNYQLMQEMTLNLIDYFKYIFRRKNDFVRLKEEIEHVEIYLHFQQIRFSQNLTYDIDCAYFLADTGVPILIIQTFIENSIKHSYTTEHEFNISVSVDFAVINNVRSVIIKIRDNGKGFSDEDMQYIEDEKNYENNEHTGIWNIKRRLNLLYGEKAHLHFFNDEGAVVEIFIPIRMWQ